MWDARCGTGVCIQTSVLLLWCAVSALCAAAAVGFAMWRPRHALLRSLWALLLLMGEVLPFVLLWLAWRATTFVIPFLGPPVRIGLLPVWWALAGVLLGYVAAVVDAWRHRRWTMALLPPVHGVWAGWRCLRG